MFQNHVPNYTHQTELIPSSAGTIIGALGEISGDDPDKEELLLEKAGK